MCGSTLPETANPQHEKGIDGPIRQPEWQAMTCRWQGRFIYPGHPQGMPEYPPYRYAFHAPPPCGHGMRTGIGLVCGGQANNGDRRPSISARQGVCHASGGRGADLRSSAINKMGRQIGPGQSRKDGRRGQESWLPTEGAETVRRPATVASGQAHGEG